MALHKVEQELGTEIKPIPKIIDPRLYVAEYQNEDTFEVNDIKTIQQQSENQQTLQQPQQQSNQPAQSPQQLLKAQQ
jgi:hypothetical protein